MDLLINTFGTRIRSSGERIILNLPNSKKALEYPIRRIEKIVILRPSSISTNAVQLALEHDVDIVYLGSFGKPIGRIFPSNPKGLAELRRAQLEISNSSKAFDLAKAFVKGKIENQYKYLKYLEKKENKSFEKELIQIESVASFLNFAKDAPKGKENLLGIEGYVAERYFSCLKKLYSFPGRKPQGRDKFNSALNYGYGILYNEVERACSFVGLDPYLGLYHTERYGKPALVLDLVEEFRVPVVDSVIFPLFLEKKLTANSNFKRIKTNEYQLSVDGKQKVVEAIFKRLHETVVWEEKKNLVEIAIELQVRSLAHIFLNRKEHYNPFTLTAIKEYE